MPNNYLVVVEGEKTEKSILKIILERYGFNFISCNEKLDVQEIGRFTKIDFANKKDNIVVIQGPKTRIHDFLLYFRKNPNIDTEHIFNFKTCFFKGIFIVYDVDHNDEEDIEEMFSIFDDEFNNGLLLLSSPCIEVIGDEDFEIKRGRWKHVTEYKHELNKYCYDHFNHGIEEHIKNNFSKEMLRLLSKNHKEFKNNNVMEHPQEIIEFINKNNIRHNEKNNTYVLYKYFSSVFYVILAFIAGKTREIDNFEEVKKYYEELGKKD